jgi:hypothetical protein
MIKRNTILIIGNGFDIAHGLPTKYSDFADYLTKKIAKDILRIIIHFSNLNLKNVMTSTTKAVNLLTLK